MYIEICQDVIEDAIAKSGFDVNDSLDLLLLFAMFSSKGNHIVTVPCLRKNKEMVNQLVRMMGRSYVKKLLRGESQFYKLQTLKTYLSVYCLITYSDNKCQDNRAIVVNPLRMKNFEPFLKTKIITENLLDADFFNYVVHYYLRQTLKKGVRINYEVIPGGGSTTCDVVKRELTEEKRFCLVIADSDKKYPNQHDYGDTAKKIIDVITRYPSCICRHYIMEKVMEIENLIPNKIVKRYASDKSDCNILERDFSFYDMKIGLTLKGLYDDGVFEYQKTIFPELDYTQRKDAKNHTSCREEYEKYIDDHHLTNVLKKGFGSDLLKNVTCACDNKGKIKYPELRDEMINNINPSDLTTEQREEWEHIGELMFSWTCGLPAKSY